MFQTWNSFIGVYELRSKYYRELVKDIEVSNEKASFIVKAIMGRAPFIIYKYQDKVVKGKAIIKAILDCLDGKVIFEGPLFEELNGKSLKDVAIEWEAKLMEREIPIVDFDKSCNEEEVRYFLNNFERFF